MSVSDENSSDNKFFNETKSQKTDNARRKLPLTDLLIKDFRFLTFVEKRKNILKHEKECLLVFFNGHI